MAKRFIRGIPASHARPQTPNPPWVISLAEYSGRNPDTCPHGTVVKGIAVWANDEIRRKYRVPPGDRALVFLPNDEEEGWCACALCGSLRNEKGEWILLYSRRTVET